MRRISGHLIVTNKPTEREMNLRYCDCCGKQFKELNRVEVGKHNVEWFVCADCYTNTVPHISKETEVPLLSVKLGLRIPKRRK